MVEALASTCQHQETLKELDRVIQEHKGKPGDLIQVLHWTQENLGFIPREAQEKIAEGLGVSLSEVYGVVTFYSFFSLKPKGKYQISCCKGTACFVRGAPEVLEKFEKELKIKPGDTSDDGLFSLDLVRCLGACGLSPVITVNKDTYGRMKTEMVPSIIKKYANSQ